MERRRCDGSGVEPSIEKLLAQRDAALERSHALGSALFLVFRAYAEHMKEHSGMLAAVGLVMPRVSGDTLASIWNVLDKEHRDMFTRQTSLTFRGRALRPLGVS